MAWALIDPYDGGVLGNYRTKAQAKAARGSIFSRVKGVRYKKNSGKAAKRNTPKRKPAKKNKRKKPAMKRKATKKKSTARTKPNPGAKLKASINQMKPNTWYPSTLAGAKVKVKRKGMGLEIKPIGKRKRSR